MNDRMYDRNRAVDGRLQILDDDLPLISVMTTSRVERVSRQHEALMSEIKPPRDDVRRVNVSPSAGYATAEMSEKCGTLA